MVVLHCSNRISVEHVFSSHVLMQQLACTAPEGSAGEFELQLL
jgi:hypothetical protein